MQINLVTRDLHTVNSQGKEIEQNMLWKKIILKNNITSKYIKHKHKNTGTSSCKSIYISKWHCLNSHTKCWKPASLKPSFQLPVAIWSPFSGLICFNGVHKKIFTSSLLEENLWTYDKLDVLMHEKHILWEVTAPK